MTRAELQTLIANAVHTRIEIPPGEHVMDGDVFVSGKNRVHIDGPGALDFQGQFKFIFNKGSGNQASTDCRLTGVGILGGSVAVKACHRITIRDCVIDGGNGSGINFGIRVEQQSHDVLIERNSVLNFDTGIQIVAPDIVVSKNIIRKCETAISVDAPACWIDGNHVFPDAGTMEEGLVFENDADHLMLVTHNYIDNVSEKFIESDTNGPSVVRNMFLRVDHQTAEWVDGSLTDMEHNLFHVHVPGQNQNSKYL